MQKDITELAKGDISMPLPIPIQTAATTIPDPGSGTSGSIMSTILVLKQEAKHIY